MTIAKTFDIDTIPVKEMLTNFRFNVQICNYDNEREYDLEHIIAKIKESAHEVLFSIVLPTSSPETIISDLVNTYNNIKSIDVDHRDADNNTIFTTSYQVEEFSNWEITSEANGDDLLFFTAYFVTSPRVKVSNDEEELMSWVKSKGGQAND